MKIFVSHSSRQKLFVRDLRNRLPDAVQLWIDEREIAIGEPIDKSLKKAILGSDFFLIVVDKHAARSEWVRREIDWALEHEVGLGRTFFLPIVLEREAWQELSGGTLDHRRFLSCADFSEESLASVASQLSSELFTLLARDWSRREEPDEDSTLGVLEKADDLSRTVASKIRTIVHPHRRGNPLSVLELLARLREQAGIAEIPAGDLENLIERLKRSGFLGGVFYDGEIAYLAMERYSYKTALFQEAKERIARAAANIVRPGDSVGFDGGSTAVAAAGRIAEQLRSQGLADLKVFTNSLPVASLLLETLSDLDAGDSDPRCQVTLLGGWCRPISMCVVPPRVTNRETAASGVDPFALLPDRLDVAFLGANGLVEGEHFGIKHAYERPAKRALLVRAKERVVLVDPSKFAVPQDVVFAKLDEGLRIVTAPVAGYESALDSFAEVVQGTKSVLDITK